MMDKMARRIGESFTWVMGMVMEGASKKQKALLPLLAVLMMGFPLQNHYNRWMAAVFDDTPISKQENKNLNKAMMGGVAPAIIVVIVPFICYLPRCEAQKLSHRRFLAHHCWHNKSAKGANGPYCKAYI